MKKNRFRIVMQGGLGNQLFQWAFGLYLQRQYPDAEVWLDGWTYRYDAYHQGIEIQKLFVTEQAESFARINASRRLLGRFKSLRPLVSGAIAVYYRLCGFHTIYDTQLAEEASLKRLVWDNEHLSFGGYFQQAMYAKAVEDELKSRYRPTLTPRNRDLLDGRLKNRTLVAVHIRRGDYLNIPDYGVLENLSYYHLAIAYMQNRVAHPYFLIFSDDPTWVKANLMLEDCTVVDWNVGDESFQDLVLMSECHHQIIANSSFSWWAAFMNKHPEKLIIAPKRWFAHKTSDCIVPAEWIQM